MNMVDAFRFRGKMRSSFGRNRRQRICRSARLREKRKESRKDERQEGQKRREGMQGEGRGKEKRRGQQEEGRKEGEKKKGKRKTRSEGDGKRKGKTKTRSEGEGKKKRRNRNRSSYFRYSFRLRCLLPSLASCCSRAQKAAASIRYRDRAARRTVTHQSTCEWRKRKKAKRNFERV